MENIKHNNSCIHLKGNAFLLLSFLLDNPQKSFSLAAAFSPKEPKGSSESVNKAFAKKKKIFYYKHNINNMINYI